MLERLSSAPLHASLRAFARRTALAPVTAAPRRSLPALPPVWPLPKKNVRTGIIRPTTSAFSSRPFSTYPPVRSAASGSRTSSSGKQRRIYLSPTTLVLVCVPLLTFALGVWQVRRLRWKVNLIQELEDKLHREPMSLPRRINFEALPEFAYRLVRLTGRFDEGRSMFVGPKVREGVNGYHVVTPFEREGGGGKVLVNRGFVDGRKVRDVGGGRKALVGPAESGPVSFVAMLRTATRPNMFTPANDPATNTWYWTDVDAMSQFSSTGDVKDEETRVLPVLLDQVFDGNAGEASARVAKGVPVGRAPSIELRNQHLTYAVTWFSLSGATSLMLFRLLRRGHS